MDKSNPHPVLTKHYQTLEEKQAFLRRAFDAAAPFYEGIISWGFFGTGDWYRRQALVRCGLKPGMRVADIASGTGPTARAAAQIIEDPNLITCVEPSEGMLNESKKRLKCEHLLGCADDLPLEGMQFDFLTMGFALRHVDNLETAFREYYRVLKPGGITCILDTTKPEGAIETFFVRSYFRDILPRLTHLITRSQDATYLMKYYWETIDQMVDPEYVLTLLERAGFQEVQRHVVLGIFSEYTARKP